MGASAGATPDNATPPGWEDAGLNAIAAAAGCPITALAAAMTAKAPTTVQEKLSKSLWRQNRRWVDRRNGGEITAWSWETAHEKLSNEELRAAIQVRVGLQARNYALTALGRAGSVTHHNGHRRLMSVISATLQGSGIDVAQEPAGLMDGQGRPDFVMWSKDGTTPILFDVSRASAQDGAKKRENEKAIRYKKDTVARAFTFQPRVFRLLGNAGPATRRSMRMLTDRAGPAAPAVCWRDSSWR